MSSSQKCFQEHNFYVFNTVEYRASKQVGCRRHGMPWQISYVLDIMEYLKCLHDTSHIVSTSFGLNKAFNHVVIKVKRLLFLLGEGLSVRELNGRFEVNDISWGRGWALSMFRLRWTREPIE